MEVWFYTYNLMEDGKTPISVCAYNDIQAKRFIQNGWRPVEEIKHEKSRGNKKQGPEPSGLKF